MLNITSTKLVLSFQKMISEITECMHVEFIIGIDNAYCITMELSFYTPTV